MQSDDIMGIWDQIFESNEVAIDAPNFPASIDRAVQSVQDDYRYIIETIMSWNPAVQAAGRSLIESNAFSRSTTNPRPVEGNPGVLRFSVARPNIGLFQGGAFEYYDNPLAGLYGMAAIVSQLINSNRINISESQLVEWGLSEALFRFNLRQDTLKDQENINELLSQHRKQLFNLEEQYSTRLHDIQDKINSIEGIAKLSDQFRSDTQRAIHDQIASIRTLSEIAFNEAKAVLTQKAGEFESELAVLSNRTNQAIGRVDTMIDKSENDINGLVAEVSGKVELKHANALYSQRARQSWWLFLAPIGLVIALLIGMAAGVIGYHEDVLRYVHDSMEPVGTGTQQSTSLALVSQIRGLIVVVLPLVAVLWALRMIVRFAMRSLALHDDAKLREVLLDTHLVLTGKGDTTPEQRSIMLTALFRPLPGQQPDIEPPVVTEIIQSVRPSK